MQVREAQPQHAFDLLSAADVDIAVVVAIPDMPAPDDPAFEQYTLYNEPLDLLVASGHHLADRASIALADATAEAWDSRL